jgi:hypothetical protein
MYVFILGIACGEQNPPMALPAHRGDGVPFGKGFAAYPGEEDATGS